MKLRHAPLLLAACVAVPGVASAQSETSASAEIGLSLGAASNPFSGPGGGAAYADLSFRPVIGIRTVRDTLTLAGDVDLQQYFSRYSTRDNYNAVLSYARKQSDRLSFSASLAYANSISGSAFSGVAIAPDPTSPTLPVVASDLGLFGTGNRVSTFNGQVGASYQLSDRDDISAFANGLTTSNTRGGTALDYHGFGGGLSYSRRLNEKIRVGVNGAVNTTTYNSGGTNNVYSAEASLDARLNERWTLNGSLGLSFLDSSGNFGSFGPTPAQTTVSGHATFCRTWPGGPICLTASRAILPSSFGGARTQTALLATYSRRLSERTSIDASASFTQVDGTAAGAGGAFGQGGAYRYWSASAGYHRRLRQRLGVAASASYRKVSGGILNQSDDVAGQVGLTYSIGRAR